MSLIAEEHKFSKNTPLVILKLILFFNTGKKERKKRRSKQLMLASRQILSPKLTALVFFGGDFVEVGF